MVLACARTVPVPSAPDPVPEGLGDRAAAAALGPAAATERAVARIAALDPVLRAVITVDPGASATGYGPLTGVPVLVKDNVDVAGMPTTAGSLALAGHLPADDAFLVQQLRASGAVVLGKTNLSEWANFRSTRSSSGWSGVGGQARNPYALDRSPCGSSSGSAIAVAAGYVPLAVATETDGSILCPASVVGVVGVKPTVGVVSRDGIVPISHSQDTAGPMAWTVADAAALLEVLAVADPADPATARRPAGWSPSFVAALRADALSGVTLGVARDLGAFHPEVVARFEAALAELESLGAVLVDVPLTDEGIGDDEMEVLVHEFRPDLERYLADAPVHTLDALIAFDREHAAGELQWFGQELFEQAAAHPDDAEAYAAAVARLARVGPDRIDAALQQAGAAAIVAPTTGPAWSIDWVNGDAYTGGTSTITAVSGYPAVTVPMGRVHGLPVGLTFLGTAFDEGRLLALAHAYEQGTHHAERPRFAPTVAGDAPATPR